MTDPANWRSRRPQSASAPDGDWSAPKTGVIWSQAAGHNATVGLMLVAVVALIGAFVYYVLPADQPQTPLLALVASDYQEPAPPNPLATEDLDWLGQTFPSEYRNVRLEIPDGDTQTTEGFLGRVREFLDDPRNSPGSRHTRPLLIYLSAIGMLNSAGEPCLLLPAHRALDDSTWLPWSILRREIEQSRPEGAEVVLLLDGSQLQTDWSLGVIQNGFITLLDEQLARESDDWLTVFSASSGIQSRVAAPARAATPFAYFAATGLRGAADAQFDADGDITLGEFVSYVEEGVANWTRNHAGLEQRPKLLGAPPVERGDLVLAAVASFRSASELRAESIDSAAIDAIAQSWTAFSQAGDKGVAAPVARARVNGDLRRSDEYLLAGQRYLSRLPKTGEASLELLRQARPYAENLRPGSLPEHSRWAPFASTTAALLEAWDAWRENPKENPPPANYCDRVAAAWSRLLGAESPLDRSALGHALTFIDSPRATSRPAFDLAEVALVRLLHAHADWSSGALPGVAPLLGAYGQVFNHAIPARPEAAHWVAPYLAPVELDLHRALDIFLVGDVDSRRASRRLVTASMSRLAELGRLSRAATDAYHARNAAFEFALGAGEWSQRLALLRPREGRRLLDRDVAALVVAAETLSRTLVQGPSKPSQSETRKQLVEETQQVRSRLEEIRRRYAARVDALSQREQGSLVETRPERGLLISSPLVVDADWLALHDVHLRAEESGDGQFVEPASDADHLKWLIEVEHPLRRLVGSPRSTLQADASVPECLRELAKLGGAVRELIARCGGDVDQAAEQTRRLLPNSDLVAARRPLADAADRLRRAVPLARGRLSIRRPKRHAVERLRDLDSHAWSLWQAQRANDSFWRAETMDEPAWFAKEAGARLDEARQTFAASGSATVEETARRLDRTVAELREWRPIDPSQVVAARGLPQVTASLDSNPLANHGQTVAAVSLLEPNGTRFDNAGGLARRRLALRNPASLSFAFNGEILSGVDGLTARTLLRGHTWDSPLRVLRPVEVSYRRKANPPATIRVTADRPATTDIVFVFDCSASMGKPIGLSQKTRFAAARDALTSALEGLRSQGSSDRAALLFYGRRAGERDGKAVFKRRAAFRGHPGEDVEVSLGLRSLDQFVDDLSGVFLDASPWGITPLYRSIDRALDHLASSAASGRKRVVVLSDGVNYAGREEYELAVPLPGQNLVKLTQTYSAGDVRRRLEAFLGPIPQVDVILFGDPGTTALRDLAEASGGRLTEAGDADIGAKWLEDRLREALGVEDFLVKSTAPPPFEEWRCLGGQVTTPKPGGYSVSLERGSATLAAHLEGGEALELLYQRRQGRLITKPFEVGQDSTTAGPFLVGIDVPRRVNDWYAFRIALQRRDPGQLCRRPEVVWAKITPHQTDPQARSVRASRYFFDRAFAPGEPTPVLEFEVPSWRSRSRQATAEIRFAMQTPASARSISVDRLDETGAIRTFAGAELAVERLSVADGGLRVVVQEKHRQGDNYPLHVQIDPPADVVTRSFSDATKQVVHVFGYEKNVAAPRLQLLTKRQITDAGVGPVTLEVTLPP